MRHFLEPQSSQSTTAEGFSLSGEWFFRQTTANNWTQCQSRKSSCRRAATRANSSGSSCLEKLILSTYRELEQCSNISPAPGFVLPQRITECCFDTAEEREKVFYTETFHFKLWLHPPKQNRCGAVRCRSTRNIYEEDHSRTMTSHTCQHPRPTRAHELSDVTSADSSRFCRSPC